LQSFLKKASEMGKSQYIVQFGGLPVGIHEFEFEVKDKFFQDIENSEVRNADVKVNATLTKQNHLLQMDFNIEGVVGVDCDRCLKTFGLPVEAHESLVIKHGDPSESTDEILVIPFGDTEFDISQYLYEYISLAVPARRVPCEMDAEAFECDYETLDKLKQMQVEDSPEPENPIWNELNKIKFNKN
jgi:uncharacterized protein